MLFGHFRFLKGFEMLWKKLRLVIFALSALQMTCVCNATRIKDIVDIQGIRGNPLVGIGLVVGLNNTGDSTLPSRQMLASFLQRNGGMTYSPTDLTSGSVAVAIVTAELGAWDRVGSRIDIHISAFGDAKSLQGGLLLPTELKGMDGPDATVYAVASAMSISTASWTVEGNTGSRIAKNHPTAGRIIGGAIVENEELGEFYEIVGGIRYVTLHLRDKDFTTAERIREYVDSVYPDSAFAEDPGTIRVRVPDAISELDMSAFISRITQGEVEVDMPAIVVINERTGTIVAGGNVGISETAVAQGSLVVKINETQSVSQPTTPFTDGATTEVVDQSNLNVQEEKGHLIRVPRVVTVVELAKALNAIGATPRDLLSIFIALKDAGALQARIEMR